MNFEKLNDLAKFYFDKKDFQSALNVLKSIKLPNEYIPNLAKCYYYTNQANKALECILPLPKTTELLIDIALYYNAIGNHDKAFDIYSNLDQTNDKVKFNIAWHYLRNGDFKKGFNLIQSGSKFRVWGNEYIYVEQNKLDINKRWKGDYVDNLLLILEGGLGDQIIFLRWANFLQQKCKNLTIACDKSLLRLLVNSNYNCIPLDFFQSAQYDFYVPAMSIPSILELNHPAEKVNFPYISSFAEKYIIKQMDLLANGRKKIGLKFYGNKQFEHEQFRSPPRNELEKLSKYGQCFSLQLEEKEGIFPNCNILIKDWQDTYSVFKGLDLLVTSCTSTAHLAGAIGLKCVVLVPLVPYFVWASDNQKWYPENVEVIRQTKYNDWSEAIDKLNLYMERSF